MQNITYDLGNLADWISAIGTIGALFFAIFLATKDTRTKIEITIINDRRRMLLNEKNPDTYEICVVNTRSRVIHLRSMSMYVKERNKEKKRIARITDGQEPILGSIQFGEIKTHKIESNYSISYEQNVKGTKFYVVFEDITGKKFKKRFNINTLID